MSDRLFRRLAVFAKDEDGSSAVSWLYAGLLLLILGGITQDQWMHELRDLRMRLHLDRPVAGLFRTN